MRTRKIVVGTDGTAAGGAAVRWAAHEASRRHDLLRIVHAFDWEWRAARYGSGSEYLDEARQLADGVIAVAIDQARAAAPGISLEAGAVIGNAVPHLLDAADGADFVVVGSRGRGGLAGLLLGSVSQRIATHAPCPVVVARGRVDATDGPIVVGVDDSPAADRVLETAFEVAGSRGCPLAVVHTYLPPIPPWIADIPASAVDTPESDDVEHARLEELLAPWREKYPAVPVDVMVSHDAAAAVLVGVSRRAQLVVVGSRGHGALAGALLGSTGMQLTHHADCPVLIVRPVAVPENGAPR